MLEAFETIFERLLPGTTFRKHGSNMAWIAAEKLLRLFLSFFAMIYVARQIGQERFGELSFAIGAGAIFCVGVNFGIDSLLVRELVRREKDRNCILGSGALLKFSGFLIMTVFTALYLFLANPDRETALLVVIVCAGYLFQTIQVFDPFFQSRVEVRYTVIAQMSAFLLSTALRFYFAWRNAPLWQFALLEGLYVVVSVGVAGIFYHRSGFFVKNWRPALQEMGMLARGALPLLLAELAMVVFLRTDLFFLEHYGSNEMGCYALGMRLTGIFHFIPAAVMTTFFPLLLTLREEKDPKRYRVTQKRIYALLWLGAAASVAILEFAAPWIATAVKEEYAPATLLTQIYALSLFGIFFDTPIGFYCVSAGMQNLRFVLSFLPMLLNLGLNFLWVPRLGAAGSAAAMALSAAFLLLQTLLFPRTRDLGKLILSSLWYLPSVLKGIFTSKAGSGNE